MNYIDHPVLYSDDCAEPEWTRLVEKSNCRSGFWRRYARRKMRRIAKELLSGTRPRIHMGWVGV